MSLTLNNYPNDMIFQRGQASNGVNGTRSIKFTGKFNTAKSLEYQLVDESSNVIIAWTSVTDLFISSSTYALTLTLGIGGFYRLHVRYTDLSETVISNKFAIGIQVYLCGQSNCNQVIRDIPGQSTTVNNPKHRLYVANYLAPYVNGGVTEQFVVPTSPGAAATLNRINEINPNVHVALIACASDGSRINTWNDNSTDNSPWGNFESYFRRLGGDAEFIYWMQGEADTPYFNQTTYQNYLTALQSKFNVIANRSPATQHFLGTVIAAGMSGANPAQIKAAQYAYYGNVPGFIWCGTLEGQPTSDGLHIVPGNPTAAIGWCIGHAVGYRI